MRGATARARIERGWLAVWAVARVLYMRGERHVFGTLAIVLLLLLLAHVHHAPHQGLV